MTQLGLPITIDADDGDNHKPRDQLVLHRQRAVMLHHDVIQV
jgi:hypothetical protein